MATVEQRLETARSADPVFSALRDSIESQVADGRLDLDILELSQQAGIDITEDELARLGVPQRIIGHTFLPWHVWFPWSELWSLYVQRQFPETPAFVPGRLGLSAISERLAAAPSDSMMP